MEFFLSGEDDGHFEVVGDKVADLVGAFPHFALVHEELVFEDAVDEDVAKGSKGAFFPFAFFV